MSAPLLYNPSRASFDELDAMLVARRPLLDKLVADLVADASKTTRRHWLLVGPRGSGKSHLTQWLALRLGRDHGWAVARLPEEHYQVHSVGELLEQIVLRLEGAEESPLADVATADLEDRALDRLHAWKAKHGKPVLVVVENLGLLFERKLRDRRDQARLREILGRDAPFVLVSTATSMVDATTSHEAPFYHFFQTLPLDELTRDEVVALVEARARWDRDEVLIAQLSAVRGRIHAMYHFSGGYPRLALTLYEILRGGVTDDLFTGLLKLLDDVTPYYQARLNDVSPQAGRVLVEMALAGGRLSPAVIAKRCRLATNLVTAQVAKLEAERFIRPVGRPDGRRRYYDLTDRLFRIWMQMREDRSVRQRLRFLSEFYQRWYDGQDGEVDAAMLDANVSAEQARRWFAKDAPGLISKRPERAAGVLRTYEALRDDGLLPADFPPYSSAVIVRDDPDRAMELSPEVLEAAQLLLGPPTEAASARAAVSRTAYEVPTRPAAVLAAAEPTRRTPERP